VRELDQWVRDTLIEDGLAAKGMLVANTWSETAPGQRNDPYPPNCVEAAKRSGQCLVTTSQLLRALIDDQEGRLDRSAFWSEVMSANGPAALPEL